MTDWLYPAAFVLALAVCAAQLAPATAEEGDEPVPVLVELFTSQGCSSCPPADRLLSRLGDEGLPGDVVVIPLSFHVDYWNYIGWTDPFSSKAWSDRQRGYARAMALDTIYTPQAVVQGDAEMVGSNADAVLRAIARAQSRGTAVAIDLRTERANEGSLRTALAARITKAVPGHGLDLMVALFEKRLVTPVARGENAARTLENDFVVRALRRAAEIDGRIGATASGSVTFGLDRDWKTGNLGVAAFAQDPATLRIFGAARSPDG